MDKYDYSDFDWDIGPNDIYDIHFREKFVQEFRIEKHLANDFFLHLEGALPYATKMADLRSEFQNEKSVKSAWAAISSSATKLMIDLSRAEEVLDESVATNLGWHMIDQSPSAYIASRRIPKSIEEADAQDALYDYYEQKALEIVATVTTFSQLVSELLKELPPTKRGPKLDWHLFFWVDGIRTSWEQYLGRKFTRDVDDSGEPISDAAQFVAMATEGTPYDKTAALNMMKKLISRSREDNIH